MAAPKIAVYSLPDLKNTTDDALPNYLTSLKFEQSHFLTDVRLTLGYTAVIIAAVTFAFDYKLGWDATKGHTLWAVIAYFVLNSALTVWIWGVERSKVFTGESNGALISIASTVTKHTPIYKLTVRYSDPTKSEPWDWETLEISAPFTRWFSADGYFVAKPFQQWLASEIPIVGQADRKLAEQPSKNAIKEDLKVDSKSKSEAPIGTAAGARSRKGKK
ncbi:hypothetical protein MMC24_005258 [Lignoscripta atroalba]|nr:hypothetical protein [Lignoscripta atroalba]